MSTEAPVKSRTAKKREKPVTGITSPSVRRPLIAKKKVIFVLITLVSTWLFAEGMVLIYLRKYDFYWASEKESKPRLVDEMPNNLVSNDRYIWGYQPGSEFVYTDPRDNATYHVRVNSEGFRDEEPIARQAADFQFVALGNSFTFGWLVETPDRWDEVLAKSIGEKHGLKAASINRGMWMTTFDQHALMLEDNFPTGPCKAVIHFVYPSHLQTANRHKVETENGKIVKIYDPLLHLKNNALFFGAADKALVHKQLSFPFTRCMWDFHKNLRLLKDKINHAHSIPEMTDEQIYQKETQAVLNNGYDLMERSISQISAFLKSRGIPYIVVVIPRDRQVNEAEWNGNSPVSEILNSNIPQERFRKACEATNYAVMLDLLPHMRKRYSDKLYYKHDAHWQPDGHRMAAELVRELLVKRGILPAAGANP